MSARNDGSAHFVSFGLLVNALIIKFNTQVYIKSKFSMLFSKKRYEVIVGKFVCPVPQLGDCPFSVSCFVYLEGEKAGSPKWRDVNERSKFRLELQLQELVDGQTETKTSTASPIDGLEGLTSVSGLDAKVLGNEGLRFDLDRLHIVPEIEKGTFKIHAKILRARSGRVGGSEHEVVAEADSEPFTRGDMTKHKLPEGCEKFQNCGGMR